MHTLPRGGVGGTTQYEPLSTTARLGLGGFRDCSGSYFTANISMLLLASLITFMLGIFLNNDSFEGFFNEVTWEGKETQVIICENKPTLTVNGSDPIDNQPINAMSAVAFILAGFFIGTLGAHDYISWNAKNLQGDFEEDEEEPEVDLFNGGNRRNSVRSEGTVGTMNTVRSGTSQLSEARLNTVTRVISSTLQRQDLRSHVMGERGSPAVVVRQPVWSLLFMIVLIFLGLTGFIFHASFTRLARRLDEFAFFVVLTHLVAYSWCRLVSDGLRWKTCCFDLTRYQDRASRSSRVATLFFVTIAGFIDFGMYLYLQLFDETNLDLAVLLLFFAMFVLPLFLHWYIRSGDISSFWLFFLFGAFCFGLGEILRQRDEEGVICDPNSFFQAHSVYHVLIAAAIVSLYLFFRSDAWSQAAVEEYMERYPPLPVQLPPVREDVESATRGFRLVPPVNSNTTSTEGGENDGETTTRLNPAQLLVQRQRESRRRKKGASSVRNSEIELKQRIKEAQNTTGAEVEAMWTCEECGHEDNPIRAKNCAQCGAERPSFDDMEVITPGMNAEGGVRTRNSNKRNSNKRNSNGSARVSIPRQGAGKRNSNKRLSTPNEENGESGQRGGVNSNSRDRSKDRKKRRYDSLKKQRVIPVAKQEQTQTTQAPQLQGSERIKYEQQRMRTMERVKARTLERQRQREVMKQKSMGEGDMSEGARNESGLFEPHPPTTPRNSARSNPRVSNPRGSNQRASNPRTSNPRTSNPRVSGSRLSDQRTGGRHLAASLERRETNAEKRESQRSAVAERRESRQRERAERRESRQRERAERREQRTQPRSSRNRRQTGQGVVPVPVPLNNQRTGERRGAGGNNGNGNNGVVPPPNVRVKKQRPKSLDDDPPI